MKKAILALLLSLSLVFVLAFSSAASETEASPVAYTDEDGNRRIDYADGSYTVVTPVVKVTDSDSNPAARAAIFTTSGEVSATNYAKDGDVNWVYTLIGLFQYRPGVSSICKHSDYKVSISGAGWEFSNPSNTYMDNAAYGYGIFEHKIFFVTNTTITVDLRIRCDTYGEFY